MTKINQAVILAGGIGTRLLPITKTVPKPMVPVNGRPFLEYLVEMLKENGIKEIVLCLGYLPEKITEYFGDGSKFGIKIKYSIGDVGFDTGKRIKHATSFLDNVFLLMYCDNYWPLRLEELVKFHEKHGSKATVTVYDNRDCITKSNIKVQDGKVVKYDKTRKEKDVNGVDIGFFIMGRELVSEMPETNFSLGKDFLPVLVEKRKLSGYLTGQRYYSIGSIDRLPVTEKFLKPKRVVFLDRDGVINKKAPKADYVKKWEEFEFLPGALEGIKALTERGYDIYIITNQPGIARGMMTEHDLKTIHGNMTKEIENHGGKVSGIYYCPHGWDEGCICRKPKPGMLLKACSDNFIDPTKTVFIGDDERDKEAGDAAGCRTILVDPEEGLVGALKEL